jgi:hypothetical protein
MHVLPTATGDAAEGADGTRQLLGIPHKKKGGHIQGRHGNHYDPSRTKRGLLSGTQRTVLVQTSSSSWHVPCTDTAARLRNICYSAGMPSCDLTCMHVLPTATGDAAEGTDGTRQLLGIPHKKKGGHIQGRHGNHYDPSRTKRGLRHLLTGGSMAHVQLQVVCRSCGPCQRVMQLHRRCQLATTVCQPPTLKVERL